MRPTLLALGLASTLVLGACGTSTEADAGATDSRSSTTAAPPLSADPSPTRSSAGAVAAGSYVDWADYDADPAAYADTDVVLFFHAPWCPSCRATEESLNADGVPDGLTIVKVDFDSATDLRQEYGVTVQHTFVQVDGDGTAVKKWTGTLSGADIAAELA